MNHANAIEKLIDQGEAVQAYAAIDNLLLLGPKNVGVLKLHARLLSEEGRFDEEAEVWLKVLKIDREDSDAINFFLNLQREDKEHFFFSEAIVTGGRKYLTFPKAFLRSALWGFFGCTGFLATAEIMAKNGFWANTAIVFGSFFILVVLPWIAIGYSLATSFKAVSITPDALVLHKRFRDITLPWAQLTDICIAFSRYPDKERLGVMAFSKTSEGRPYFLNLDRKASIRARSHFLRDLATAAGGLRISEYHKVIGASTRPHII